MGFFSIIGSALGLINSNPTASALAKDISSGVDMLIYTSEEKAIDSAADATRKIKATEQAMSSWLKQIELTKASEAYRSITRRVIALGTIGNMWCLIWLCVTIELANTFGWISPLGLVEVDSVKLTSLTWTVLKIASIFELGWVFCTIIVFYFGPQLAQILKGSK